RWATSCACAAATTGPSAPARSSRRTLTGRSSRADRPRSIPGQPGDGVEVVPAHGALAALDLVDDLDDGGVDRSGNALARAELDDIAGLHVDLGRPALDAQVAPQAGLVLDRTAHVVADGQDGLGGALLVVVAGCEGHRVDEHDRYPWQGLGHRGVVDLEGRPATEVQAQWVVDDVVDRRVDAGGDEGHARPGHLAPQVAPDVVCRLGRHGIAQHLRQPLDARRDLPIQLAEVDRALVGEL